MSELKPCPFCGGDGRINRDYDEDGFGCFYSIKCNKCGATSQQKYASSGKILR